jgi:NitT/TauT family transport system substrate-binding protein
MNNTIRFLAVLVVSGSTFGCDKSSNQSAPSVSAQQSVATQVAPASATVSATPPQAPEPTGPALRIAYSDWPGWVAWEIAIQKGWFKEAGVNVEFKWFEYAPSMEAYSAGKVDAVCVTNGDALVTGSSGAKSIGIVINDYSDGNDMIVAKPGITSMAQLKGKKVGVEVGFVDHLLLMYALKSAGMTEQDIKIKNVPTDQTPQTLKSGGVDAIAAWQPNSGAALRLVPGSTPIFTSANVPGIIYDELVVNPKSLAERKLDWVRVVKVWDRIAKFINDPKTVDESAKIMSARVGLSPEQYRGLMKGTHIMDLAEAKKHWVKGDTLESVYGSSKVVNEFNLKNKVYKTSMPIDEYQDPSLSEEASK